MESDDGITRGYLLRGGHTGVERNRRLYIIINSFCSSRYMIFRGKTEIAILFFFENIPDDLTLEKAQENKRKKEKDDDYNKNNEMFGIINIDFDFPSID